MTISSTTSRWDYTGDGATTDFTYNNRIFEDSDLEVYVDGALQTLDTNYSVTGVDSESGGEVQFTSAPANDAEIVIVRSVTNTQGTNYPSGGPLPAKTVEIDLDRRTVVDQDQDENFARTLKIPKADQGSPTTELPAKADRADTFIKFDSNGDVTTKPVAEVPTGERIKELYEAEDDTNAYTDSEKTKLAGIEAGATAGDDNAFHDDESGEIAALTGKTTPVDADVTIIEDSAASNAKKKLSWANIKATLKTYLDTLYITGPGSSTDNAWARFDGTGGKTAQDGQWTEADSGDVTAGGSLNMGDNEIIRPKIKDYGETVNAIGSIGGGTQDIDLELGNMVTATVDTSETTFTFSNPPASGTAGSFTLGLTNGGSQTVNWPASVNWAGGTAPGLTAAGVDVLTFLTVDGGTNWYGFPAGLDMQ